MRVILSFASFCVYEQPEWFFLLYVTSFLLDAADGHLARTFKQCTLALARSLVRSRSHSLDSLPSIHRSKSGSRFGAVLDMVTDRFSTAILCVILTHLYQEYAKIFMFLIVLDIVSHWISMYSSLLVGSDSHKTMRDDVPRLLHLYYTNRTVLGLVCLGNELFYVFLYVAPFVPQLLLQYPVLNVYTGGDLAGLVRLAIYACFPVHALKQVINVIQMVNASNDIVAWDFRTSYSRSS